MATFIEMPKLSDTMTEGTLVKWLKSEGDRVEIGDVIAEVETDKATMEMEAFDDGLLGKIYVKEGEKIAIGGRMAVLVEEGEDPPASPDDDAAPASKATADEKPAAKDQGEETKQPTAAETEQPEDAKSEAAEDAESGDGKRIKASPLARKIAEEKNVSLSGLKGSGPGGRIVKADVLKAAEAGGGAGAPPAAAQIPAAKAGKGDRKIPVTGIRAIIAERLLASKTQLPHFYAHIDVDAAPLMALRAQINQAAEKKAKPADEAEPNKYTVNDFVLKAVVAAAVETPAINASFAGDHIVEFGSVHLAVAVAIEGGLVTPVVRGAENLSLIEISRVVKDLAARARSKKLKPDEMQGGTITVSNLGGYGVDSFDAIINPPQAAILSVGAIRKTPVISPDGGSVVPGLRMDVGLSADHRVVDGAVGAEFLAALRRYLEQPALMLV